MTQASQCDVICDVVSFIAARDVNFTLMETGKTSSTFRLCVVMYVLDFVRFAKEMRFKVMNISARQLDVYEAAFMGD